MNQPTKAAIIELNQLGLAFSETREGYQVVMPSDVSEPVQRRVFGIALRAFPGGFRIGRQSWTETPDSLVLTVFPR